MPTWTEGSFCSLTFPSPVSAHSSRRQGVPGSLAIACSAAESQTQICSWVGNTAPNKIKLQVQPPVKCSSFRQIYQPWDSFGTAIIKTLFYFHRTINVICIALATNKLCLAYKPMHVQHASNFRAYTVCVYPLIPCASAIQVMDN